jgi:hypothetical protein
MEGIADYDQRKYTANALRELGGRTQELCPAALSRNGKSETGAEKETWAG